MAARAPMAAKMGAQLRSISFAALKSSHPRGQHRSTTSDSERKRGKNALPNVRSRRSEAWAASAILLFAPQLSTLASTSSPLHSSFSAQNRKLAWSPIPPVRALRGETMLSAAHRPPSLPCSFVSGTCGRRNLQAASPRDRTAPHLRSVQRPFSTSNLLRSKASATDLEVEVAQSDLSTVLPLHEKLVCGVLNNGFRYCIFPNQKPEGRFYMNLEVHAGSVDEEDHQQGLAHFLEHSVFLGTEKYPSQQDMKKLFRRLGMAFNADANAFTDFRSTVYTFSAPTTGKASHVESAANLFGGGGIATGPIADSQPEEEVSDEQEEEVEDENADNTQLVLDLLHQMTFKALIRQKDVDLERGAILSELRDRNSISQRVAMAYYKFKHSDTPLPDRFPIGLEEQVESFSSEDLFAFYDAHYHPSNMCLYVVGDVDTDSVVSSIEQIFGEEPKQPRLAAKSPDTREHADPREPMTWPQRGAVITHELDRKPDKRVEIVEHSQINEFGVSFCQKEGAQGTRTVGDLRESLIDSIVGMALEFRVHELRVSSDDPLFNGVGWSYNSSPREGCSMNSFSVSCQHKNWRAALEIGLQEAARLAEYGVTQTELDQATTMLTNHYAQQAVQKDAMASSGWMKRIMASVQAGDQVLSPVHKSQVLKELAVGLNVEEVSARAKALFQPVTRFLLPDSKTTAFVTKPEGKREDESAMDDFSEEELLKVIKKGLSNPLPPDTTDIPKELLPIETLKAIEEKLAPTVESREEDDTSQVVRIALSNGMRVAYRQNDNRPNEVRIRLQGFGGRALETTDTQGLAVAASATWVNGGCGGYPPDVVSKFAAMSGITYDASCGSESLTLDLVVQTSVEGAMQKALALAWLLIEQPDFDSKALARFKLRVDRSFRSFPKSVERKTAGAFFGALFHPDDAWRVQELTPDIVKDIDVADVERIIQAQVVPSNLEVAISGDFDPEELESQLTTYFGTIGGGAGKPPPWAGKDSFRFKFAGKASVQDSVTVQDTVVRTYAMMGFPAVNRWGKLEQAGDLTLDIEPKESWPTELPSGDAYCQKMHVSRCLSVANDIISNKLFEQIREKRGLVYGIGFSWRPYRVFDGGYATVTFMPKPDQVERSIAEVKEVLSDLFQNGVTDEEFEGAKQPLVTKVREADKTNGFWIHLMEDVTGRATPKDLSCIQKVDEHYDAVTKEEVEAAMRECFGHSMEMLTIATGQSGPGEEQGEEAAEVRTLVQQKHSEGGDNRRM